MSSSVPSRHSRQLGHQTCALSSPLLPNHFLLTGLHTGRVLYSTCASKEGLRIRWRHKSGLEEFNHGHAPLLLAVFSAIWQPGKVPIAWKSSIVHPLHKHGKPPDEVSSFKGIYLTSCTCKFLERRVHRRLTSLVEEGDIIPEQLSGFRHHRSTADAISDLVSLLEEAERNRQTVHLLFLNVLTHFRTG